MLELTSDVLRQMPLPGPREGDKKARGDVLVIGGSVQVPGAALLAGTADMRAGAGRLRSIALSDFLGVRYRVKSRA
jgi:ADP-dependent NAD(P)H-hydrate dehydratase